MVKTLPARHLLTVIDYHRMGETDILRPDARVELIEGEIIDMAPIGSRRAGTVEQVTRMLHRAAGEHFMIRTQQPISLGEVDAPRSDTTIAPRLLPEVRLDLSAVFAE